jgi:hypothetical protein
VSSRWVIAHRANHTGPISSRRYQSERVFAVRFPASLMVTRHGLDIAGTRDCPTQAMLEPMPYKLKPWQWALVGVAFSIYCVLATFGIYGGFYLGFPPYTPAFLNHTRQNISQTFTLERKTLLRLVGNVREGRVEVKLNGKSIAVLLGQVNQTVLLEAGKYELLLENQQSTGEINFKLE